MFNGLGNEALYAAFRITSQFRLRDTSAFLTKTGTAFFVTNLEGKNCIVTNRHILDAGYNEPAGKYLGAVLDSVLVEGFSAANGDIKSVPVAPIAFDVMTQLSTVKFPADYFEDVACFIDPKVFVRRGSDASVEFFVRHDELADDAWIETQLSVCDFVAFPGFPPWHDKLEQRPILRTGTISSDPRTNYSDEPTAKGRRVAYEAFSFGGSSGSPVFATQKGFRATGGITVTGFREAKVVGINAGHLEGDFGTHSGVSYFIKSSAILDLIDAGG